MKKALIGMLLAMTVILAGCGAEVGSNGPTKSIEDVNRDKQKNAENLMNQDNVKIDQSIERKNIAQRIKVTNKLDQVSWIYLMGDDSNIVARFPLRGKATSGGKHLTSEEMKVSCDKGESYGDCWIEAPDDMGTYGHSGDYIFFFTPNGMLVQWNGKYLMTSEPYQINPQTKKIEYTVDAEEMAKIAMYKKQIADTPLDKAKGGQ